LIAAIENNSFHNFTKNAYCSLLTLSFLKNIDSKQS
jgi:hypothetical protein